MKFQFLTAINNHFQEGMDKHAIKRAGQMDGSRIFSYADRSNLIDLASNFSNYMQQNHKEVKEVRQITASHIQEFLAAKSETVSQASLDQYQSKFRKLELLVNDTYRSCNVDFHSVDTPQSKINGGGKLRTQMLSASDYSTLVNSTTNMNLHNALVLSYCAGLRASECSKIKASDWNATNGTLHIVDSKGKRSRTVKVPQQHLAAVGAVMRSIEGRICNCQTESLQKAMRREMQACGMADRYTGSFHLTRKAYATELYQTCRSDGMSVQRSLSAVSQSLGHGAKRNDLMKEYICTPII